MDWETLFERTEDSTVTVAAVRETLTARRTDE